MIKVYVCYLKDTGLYDKINKKHKEKFKKAQLMQYLKEKADGTYTKYGLMFWDLLLNYQYYGSKSI